MVEDLISQLSNNLYQKATHESNYIMEKMSEIYDTDKLPEVTFPMIVEIYIYQHNDPVLMDKMIRATYKRGSFCGGFIKNFNLITCKDTIIILKTPQRYIFNWYHKHVLHPVLERTDSKIFQYLYSTIIKTSCAKSS